MRPTPNKPEVSTSSQMPEIEIFSLFTRDLPTQEQKLVAPKKQTIHHEVTVLTFSLQVDEFVNKVSKICTLILLTTDS